MNVKVMKCQIVKPVDGNWKLLGDTLREIQKETHIAMNKAIQLCWEFEGFSSDYKQKFDILPKDKDITGKSLDGYVYSVISKICTKSHTGNLSQGLQLATKRWKKDKLDVQYGKKSIASFRSDCPMSIHNKSIDIVKKDNDYIARIALISNEYKKQLKLKNGKFDIIINICDNNKKTIVNRIISGDYKINACQITNHKNKWFLLVNYTFEAKPKVLDINNCMGIDLGIAKPFYLAFNNSEARYSDDTRQIDNFRKQVEARKKSIQRQGKFCGEGRIGHGVKTRVRPLEAINDKISNFRDTINHYYSSYIIKMAIRHDCGMIQMEDLTGISKDKVFLKSWSYFDLQKKIKYKAEVAGIVVRVIEPRYTSQRCSKCGNIDKENRQTQADFKCTSCGFEANADYNAAKNISVPMIDNIIADQLAKK